MISSSEPRRAKRWSHSCRGYTCSIIYYWNWGAGREAKPLPRVGFLPVHSWLRQPRSGCDCLLAIGARYFDRRRPSHCILTRLHLHKSRRLRFLSAVFPLIYSPAQPAVCVVKFWGVAAAARSRKAINVCVYYLRWPNKIIAGAFTRVGFYLRVRCASVLRCCSVFLPLALRGSDTLLTPLCSCLPTPVRFLPSQSHQSKVRTILS